MTHPLEPSREQMAELGWAAVDFVADSPGMAASPVRIERADFVVLGPHKACSCPTGQGSS
jgi:selenocysteine lyase/cysteine desulfurase